MRNDEQSESNRSNTGSYLHILATTIASIGAIGLWLFVVWLVATSWANDRIGRPGVVIGMLLMIMIAVAVTVLSWASWNEHHEKQDSDTS